MLIVSQKTNCIYNMGNITKIYKSSANKIMASVTQGEGGELAEYKSPEHCFFAIGMLASAAEGGEGVFQFPTQEEMMRNVQHGSQFKTKANRHGGS